MDPVRWKEVKRIFQCSVELPEDERKSFVAAECGGDPKLIAEVESLLATDLEGTEFLQVPLMASSPDQHEPETRSIPGYVIRRKVGEGGMGEVYEAEQIEPVRRRVALKVIKRGMDTREVIARFESERQALAIMNHPSIARVFDAGSTPSGRPYFAMEYVDGVSITEYCDHRQLEPRHRLELFREVCLAVQHAHQKGVIHRDLKPSNILVKTEGSKPVPKVIDFGVSKAIGHRLIERSLFTQVGNWVGTPEYMSPEQADLTGVDVDTRTDVYALGVVLYELLVGAKPFDPESLRRAGFDEIRRVIREDDPPKPSTRLSSLGDASTQAALNRKADPATLRRALQGDLDAISMKALEKDRTHRYGSPTELSDDLGRFLRDEPVEATPPSLPYRATKFVRRHKIGVAAAVGTIVAIVMGAGAALWQARIAGIERGKAERRFEEVHQLARSLIFDVHDAIENLAGATPAREMIVAEALQYLDRLAAESEDDADLQLDLVGAYQRIGDVQGLPSRANLGDLDGALTSYDRGLKLIEGLRKRHPDDLGMALEHARLLLRRSRVVNEAEDVGAVLEELERLREVVLPLSLEHTDHPELMGLLIQANEGLATAFADQGEYERALEIHKQNLTVELQIVSNQPDDTTAQRDVVVTRAIMGQILEWLERPAEAIDQFEIALSLLEPSLAEKPFDASLLREQAVIQRELAKNLAATERFTEAREYFRTAELTLGEILEQDPTDVLAMGDLGVAVAQLGRALAREGRSRESLTHYERALELASRMPREYFLSYDVQIYVIKIHLHRGEAMENLGERASAREAYRKAISMGKDMAEHDRSRAFGSSDLASAHFRLVASLLASPTSSDGCREAARLDRQGKEIRAFLEERNSPLGWPGPIGLRELEAALAVCSNP